MIPPSQDSSDYKVPTRQTESYLSRLRKKKDEKVKASLNLELRASPRTDFVTEASPEVSEHKKTKPNLNTISYGFGSNSTIRNSYNFQGSPMVTKQQWNENKRQLNMTTLDHIKNVASTPDNLTKNRSI